MSNVNLQLININIIKDKNINKKLIINLKLTLIKIKTISSKLN